MARTKRAAMQTYPWHTDGRDRGSLIPAKLKRCWNKCRRARAKQAMREGRDPDPPVRDHWWRFM